MRATFAKIAAVAIVAIGTIWGQAQTNPTWSRQNRVERIAAKLNLTDAQKEQAKTFFDDAPNATQPVFQELRNTHKALADAVKTSKTEVEIQQLANNQGQLTAKLVGANAIAFSKLYNILTPEQRTQADQLHAEFMSRMGRHRMLRSQ